MRSWGRRVDAALARMLGFSRSRCAELAGEGHVLINGAAAGKSDRLGAYRHHRGHIPEPKNKPTPVTDMAMLYDDEAYVVVDKPVGVAAHTGPGWEGPTVLGNLEAAGYRITSYGPPERQGIVHRLDVGTSGAMMVAKSELAYTVMKRAFKERTIEKVYHAGRGGTSTRLGYHRRAHRAPPLARMAHGRHRRREARRHPLRHP